MKRLYTPPEMFPGELITSLEGCSGASGACFYFSSEIAKSRARKNDTTVRGFHPRNVLKLLWPHFQIGLIALVFAIFFTAITAPIEGKAAEASDAQRAPDTQVRANAEALRIGDKINFALFERIERDEDKWPSHQQRLPDLSRSFLQRAELSGDRTVQESGAISLPFLGQLQAVGLTTLELETAAAKAFEAVFHRRAFVTVLSVEHNPIYIAGPVKNPGSYKYSTGMTILHAIALAGGLERPAEETWRAVETIQEERKVENARMTVSRLLARVATLRAERDRDTITVPPRLVELLGANEAAVVVADEKALRSFVLSTRQARESALGAAVEAAKNELEIANARLAPLEATVKVRTERMNALASLNTTGIASRAQVAEVQTSLFDVESRKQEALGAVAAAKHRVDKTNEELMQFRLENQAQLEIDIESANKTIMDSLTTIESGRAILNAARINLLRQMQLAKNAECTFEIVRKSAEGMEVIKADELTQLEPGDLVRLKPPPARELAQMYGQ